MDNTGNFISARPNDEIVAKHIACYYFHSSDDENFHSKFVFYPNYKHALTIYKNSDVRVNGNTSIIRPVHDETFWCYYSINKSQSFTVDLKGQFYKIGVIFNPLGLNHFVNKPICDAFTPLFSPFTYFGQELEDMANQIFLQHDVNNKVALLDAFFKKAYCGFPEVIMKRSVQAIFNSNGTIKVQQLSDTIGVSRKTLLRLFKKHLCCSVEEYKKIVMFRNALNYSQQSEDSTVTDVALYSYYYDQAHYIKHFKSVTMHSPKALLSKLIGLGNHEVYWNFEE